MNTVLRDRREKKGMSLREMSRRLEISPAYLSDLERGRRDWPAGRRKAFERELRVGKGNGKVKGKVKGVKR